MRLLTSHPQHSATASDDGFSLVEAIVSSFIVVMLFAGFGKSLGTAFLGSRDNAAAQEATAIGVEQLEFARSLSWSHVAMSGTAEGAPLIDQGALSGSESGIGGDEALVIDTAEGLIDPYGVETVDGITYDVWRYVSEAPHGLRRVIVLIQWQADGAISSHRTSTLIAEASTR